MVTVKKQEKTNAPRVVGVAVMKPLSSVTSNSWNPNQMSTFQRESLRTGLSEDGWVASEALLIWGTDQKGKRRNIIINGQHRWEEAQKLGFKEGPMVFLDNLTETQAKALTVKLDAKRGSFDQDKLGALLRSIHEDLDSPDLGLSIGIGGEDLMKLLAEPVVPVVDIDAPEGTADPEMASGLPGSTIKTVNLFFKPEQYAEWNEAIRKLAAEHKTENVTDTVLAVMRAALVEDEEAAE